MRWIRFTDTRKTAYGILEGDRVIEVIGDPFRGYGRTGKTHVLDDVRLQVPVIPRALHCAGLNYVSHVKGMAEAGIRPPNIPQKPDIAFRGNSGLLPHGEPVIIPSDAGEEVQYEGELVVVIGKRVKHVRKS